MIKKIIFFIQTPFSERDYQRYGIELLKHNGFKVEVWDITPLLVSETYELSVRRQDDFYQQLCTVFRSKADLKKNIGLLSERCVVVVFFPLDRKSLFVYRSLSANRIPYVVHLCALAGENKKIDVVKGILKSFSLKSLPGRMLGLLYRLTPHKIKGIKPPIIAITRGEDYRKSSYPIGKQTIMLPAHSFDYDIFLDMLKSQTQQSRRSAVFIDEYIPFHPDNYYQANVQHVSPEEYYPVLCGFFDFVEKKYNVEVVIAAHPRAKYDDKPDYYEGRKILYHETAKMIQKSVFVIMHQSCAINFAVMFRKPVVIITTNTVDRCMLEDPKPSWLAEYFCKKAHYIDVNPEADITSDLTINHESYDRFFRSYIKAADSEELPSWQIFANKVKSL